MLREIAPGLTPEEIEKLRWETFGQKRTLALASSKDLVSFVQQRGFVLFLPHPGVHYPSALEAAIGRPLLDYRWDDRLATLLGWKQAAVTSRRLVSTGILGGRTTLVHVSMLPDFLALSGNAGTLDDHERCFAAGQLTPDAVALCRVLAEGTSKLEGEWRQCAGLAGEAREKRFLRARTEILRRLFVVEIGSEERPGALPEPIFDLLPRAHPEAVVACRDIDAERARQHLAVRYLRNVLLVGAHEMAKLLEWDITITNATLESLVRRHQANLHPASRPRRDLYQAASTDLLSAETLRQKPK